MRSLITKLRGLFTRSAGTEFITGADLVPRNGTTISNALAQSAWVYSCVSTLAENVANVPWRLARAKAGTEDEVDTGPLVDLFRQPNPDQGAYEFWELLIYWLQLRGKFFIVGTDRAGGVLRLRNARARIAALHILPADKLTRITEGNHLAGWRYHPTVGDPLEAQYLLPDEVIYHRLPNPYDSTDGLSPLTVAGIATSGDYASGQFMRGLMMSNAQISPTYTSDQVLSDEQRAQILMAIRERQRSAGTADRPLLLYGGLKPVPPEISMVDIQFLENRRWNRQEICSVFKVPESLLGFTEDANRSVGQEQRLNFIENRILPLCNRLSEALQPIVRAVDPTLIGYLDVDALPVMAAARRSRVDVAQKLWAMGVPFNTANEELDLGLPPIEGGEVGYLPFSVQPIAQAMEPEPAPEPPSPGEETETDTPAEAQRRGEEEGNPIKGLLRDLAKLRKATAHAHTCAASDAWAASIAPAIKRKRAMLDRFFYEQRKRVLVALDAQLQKAAPPTLDAPDQNPKSEIQNIEARALDWTKLFNLPSEASKLFARMKSLLMRDLEFGGAQIWEEIGSTLDFALAPERAIEFLKQRESYIAEINRETFEAVRETLVEGLAAGDTAAQLTSRVKAEFEYCNTVRAERIATTETCIAINSGRMAGLEEAGMELKGWLSSRLETSRPAHIAAESTYADGIPLAEDFIVDGEPMAHPGDPKASPGNVINCRCLLTSVRQGKTYTPEKHLNYQEWETKFRGEGRGARGEPASASPLLCGSPFPSSSPCLCGESKAPDHLKTPSGPESLP